MTPTCSGAGPSAPSRWIAWIVVGVLLVVVVAGAGQLAFLCDDAYIHFRYAANAHAGHGLVWNAPPFRPVEGMGFLWALVLWAIWSWFGVEPPDAANPFSIACGALQFVVVAAAALRLCRRDGTRLPQAVGLLALAVIATNRTFLQWMTGGLDTALFNLPFVAWVLHAFAARERRRGAWLPCWSCFAALAALTRPDGLTLVGATVATAAVAVMQRRARLLPTLAGLLPLLAVVAQLLWRRSFYGEWLPNTYYAKVVHAWPEAGLRYFACFALENGAWLWFPVAAAWLVLECKRAGRTLFAALGNHVPGLAAAGITLFNAGYYLLVVGGDHFEYRVLSPLVPLGVLACAAMAARITNGTRLPILTVLGLGLASSAGWLHLALTRDAPYGLAAVTPHVPKACKPLARWFDQQQVWLFLRYVGQRCNFHASVLQTSVPFYPRSLRIVDPPDPVPVLVSGSVGLLGWSLADCAILDLHGLNDWVVARTPVHLRPPLGDERIEAVVAAADRDKDGCLDLAELRAALGQAFGTDPNDRSGDYLHNFMIAIHSDERPDAVSLGAAVSIVKARDVDRLMAHEHHPPPGYIEAFDPNVTVEHGMATVRPRQVPMTAERVRAIETEWREKVRQQGRR